MQQSCCKELDQKEKGGLEKRCEETSELPWKWQTSPLPVCVSNHIGPVDICFLWPLVTGMQIVTVLVNRKLDFFGHYLAFNKSALISHTGDMSSLDQTIRTYSFEKKFSITSKWFIPLYLVLLSQVSVFYLVDVLEVDKDFCLALNQMNIFK